MIGVDALITVDGVIGAAVVVSGAVPKATCISSPDTLTMHRPGGVPVPSAVPGATPSRLASIGSASRKTHRSAVRASNEAGAAEG